MQTRPGGLDVLWYWPRDLDAVAAADAELRLRLPVATIDEEIYRVPGRAARACYRNLVWWLDLDSPASVTRLPSEAVRVMRAYKRRRR